VISVHIMKTRLPPLPSTIGLANRNRARAGFFYFWLYVYMYVYVCVCVASGGLVPPRAARARSRGID
jgi:hypothetical protein